MSAKVLLLHGWGGSNSPHWQSWLAGELAKEYGCVSFLEFSNYDFPKLDVWKRELKEHLEEFKPDIVVCHSLANILWFHLCNEGNISEVTKLFLVAPPSLKCKIEELKSFFPVTAPNNLYAKEVLLVTSTNDPYLSEDEAKELQNALGVEMKVIQDGGHINAASGYGPWPWILEQINS
ncbi:alpha/beta hydrolase [bacterium]|nr:alpha/beta hydrolase [bacterium]MBU1434254.1 alpha/beta hydrolase [bacterium]MBU1503645.1 alpha/beta hydrolase [bacterium]